MFLDLKKRKNKKANLKTISADKTFTLPETPFKLADKLETSSSDIGN